MNPHRHSFYDKAPIFEKRSKYYFFYPNRLQRGCRPGLCPSLVPSLSLLNLFKCRIQSAHFLCNHMARERYQNMHFRKEKQELSCELHFSSHTRKEKALSCVDKHEGLPSAPEELHTPFDNN